MSTTINSYASYVRWNVWNEIIIEVIEYDITLKYGITQK